MHFNDVQNRAWLIRDDAVIAIQVTEPSGSNLEPRARRRHYFVLLCSGDYIEVGTETAGHIIEWLKKQNGKY